MLIKKKKILLLTLATTLGFLIKRNQQKKRKPRKWWVKPWINQSLGNLGITNEFTECNDSKTFKNYLRMDEVTFEMLLEKIKYKIQKKDTKFRECISARSKLIITLRYLATGESFVSLQYNYRVSNSAISCFIPVVCKAIYEELKNEYLKVPSTAAEWLEIANKFKEKWNFPNCIGAMDGKYILIKAQRKEGSAFYNYKKQHSIVLLAVVDADYNFLYINVGMNGRLSDGGVFRETDLNQAIGKNQLNIPEDKPLSLHTRSVPFVIVADAAFPLSTHILKPYPLTKMTKEQRIFNYRLSRARRVVENAFGILSNRFRALLNVNGLIPEKVKLVTQARCALHNFLNREMNTKYTGHDPELDVDRRYTFVYGLSAQAGNRPQRMAINTRDVFKDYVNGEGAVSWQDDMV